MFNKTSLELTLAKQFAQTFLRRLFAKKLASHVKCLSHLHKRLSDVYGNSKHLTWQRLNQKWLSNIWSKRRCSFMVVLSTFGPTIMNPSINTWKLQIVTILSNLRFFFKSPSKWLLWEFLQGFNCSLLQYQGCSQGVFSAGLHLENIYRNWSFLSKITWFCKILVNLNTWVVGSRAKIAV